MTESENVVKALSQIKDPEEFTRFYNFNRSLELADKINTEKCYDTDRQIVLHLRKKLARAEPISRDEMMMLEDIYFSLDPSNQLTPAQIEQVKNFVRRTALEDVQSGRFVNMDEALKHYGLFEETGGAQ